jgi:hypothetical protein
MASSASHGSLAQKSFKLMSKDSQNVARIKKAVFELQKKFEDTNNLGKRMPSTLSLKFSSSVIFHYKTKILKKFLTNSSEITKRK